MHKVTFSPYDTADYLKTEEDIAHYLEAVLEEGGNDPAFITQSLGVVARARNMSQLARDAGLTREGLYKALSADGNPTFATVVKVAKALGLRLEFRPAIPSRRQSKSVRTTGPQRSARSPKGGKRAVKVKPTQAKRTKAGAKANAPKRRRVA